MIPTLHSGGAERLLAELAQGELRAGHEVEVHTLDGATFLGARLRSAGVAVVDYQGFERGRLRGLHALVRLLARVMTTDSDAAVGWLYHGALVVALAGRRANRRYASLHHRDPRDPGVRRGTRLVFQALRLTSSRLSSIAYVTPESSRAHRVAGLRTQAMVISGGVDPDHFRPPTSHEKEAARKALGLRPKGLAVVHVARVHPDKAQWVLMAAFNEYLRLGGKADLVLVGSGWVSDHPAVKDWIQGIDPGRLRLCGELFDSREAYWAGDVFCLSSATEALPVSLVESMMCSMVPVVTDVGACGEAVEGAGIAVPPGDPYAMAQALDQAFERVEKGRLVATNARERAHQRFGLERMLNTYDELLKG